MKKTKYLAGAIGFSLMFSGTAFAAAASTTPSAVKADVEARVADMRSKIASTTAELMLRSFADGARTRIFRQFVSAGRSLENLSARIESRLEKLGAAGADVSAARILLTTANADIEVVKADLTSLQTDFAATTSTSTRASVLSGLKTDSQKTKQDMKTAQKDLVRVIVSLAAAQKSLSAASSTASSSVQ